MEQINSSTIFDEQVNTFLNIKVIKCANETKISLVNLKL